MKKPIKTMVKNSLVIIPFNIPWFWSTDYAKQTAKVLSKDNVVVCLLFEDSLSVKNWVFKPNRHKLLRKISSGFYIYTPLNLIPFNKYPLVNRLNTTLNLGLIKFFSNVVTWCFLLQKKYLWLFHPKFESLIDSFGDDYFSIYDCVDVVSMGMVKNRQKSKIIKREKELLRSVDCFVVNSKALAKIYKRIRLPDAVVPQGFRMSDFNKPLRKIDLKNHDEKYVVGFVGGISSRLDFELLISLAKSNEQWTFALYGPIQEESDKKQVIMKKIDRLLELSNVQFGCLKDKRQVPALIECFDIGIIPYDISFDFNKYCYPMKLFEYFYMGKPVVSTPIEELKRFSKFVKVSNTVEGWEKHIKKLLAKPWPEKYKRKQRKLARDNSWENKIKAISDIIESKTKTFLN